MQVVVPLLWRGCTTAILQFNGKTQINYIELNRTNTSEVKESEQLHKSLLENNQMVCNSQVLSSQSDCKFLLKTVKLENPLIK